ncbi:MAG: hypothetical protein M3N38_03895, partial [Pseudomonadota bacterium]|nr:hypothetical protein [Pseudomonadota bacterium]
RYVEGEHDCRLEYPTALFAPPEDADAAPQLFTGPNEDTYFRIMGADNTSQWTPADIKAKYLQSGVPGDVTYERTKGEFLVLSGYRGKSIFYTKVSVSDDEKTACILEITYPRAKKHQFDAIVTRMSRSFSARS